VSRGDLDSDCDIVRAAPKLDFAIIAVPTPLDARTEPDLSSVISVGQSLARNLRRLKFVILESSVYPGTTEDMLKPILERSGLMAGKDYGLAYSPEKIDYGNRERSILDIPKVVGGITELCTEIAVKLYSKVLRAPVISFCNPRTAESTEMLENRYRYVNIALVNELALLYERLGVDFFEVVAAASTKPFGFQAFHPSPAVGGYCIPKDASTRISEAMINHVVERLEHELRQKERTTKGAKAVPVGLAYKADVTDATNSTCEYLQKANGVRYASF